MFGAFANLCWQLGKIMMILPILLVLIWMLSIILTT